ncbi:PTS cellobiose transporter subunit IIC [Bacillus sp. A116_S68]|nr:PTS cellobiose transporter subunit IIC [Bacillus sp. A116_S68]
MSNFTTLLERKVMPFAGKLAAQRHLQALRDGIILTMPLIIVGSVFLILANLPVPGYTDFMANIFGDEWATKLQYPVGVTFDIMALVAGFGVAYRLAEKYELDALTSGAISLAAFLLATPYQVSFIPNGESEAILVDGGIPLALTGSQGLFIALIIAMVSTEIYRFIVSKNLVIRMPDGVPPAVTKSFIALIPGFAVITTIWIARIMIEMTPFGDLHNLVFQVVGAPLSLVGGSLLGSLVAVFIMMFLWSAGIHGANIVGGIMAPIWYGAMDENRLAFQAGEELPNIFTQQFFEVFINLGGSGATLGLVLMMLFWAKSKQMKQLGKLAAGPAAFNINEPVIFGTPVVLNPMLIVPFILTPLTLVVTTYIGMSTGLVAKPAGIAVPWTMPPIISGYLATGGSISGSIMQIINISIGLIIYFGFFRLWDRQKFAEETISSSKTSNKSHG